MEYLMVLGVIVLIGGVAFGVFGYLSITKLGGLIMATLVELQAKVDELVAVEQAREARDVAQDAVTAQQIALLQTTVDELRAVIAAGGLSAADQAIVDASVGKLDATIASLNAADPTAPVV